MTKSLSIKKYLIFSIIAIYGIFGIGMFSVKATTYIDLNFDDSTLTGAIEQMNKKYDNVFDKLVSIAKQYESQGFIFCIQFKPWKTGIGAIDIIVYKFTDYNSLSYSGSGGGFNFGASNYEGYRFSIGISGDITVSAAEIKLQSLVDSLNDYESSFSTYNGSSLASGAQFRVTNGKLDFSWNYGSSYSSIMYYITETEEYPFSYNPYFDGKYTLDGQTIENGSPYPSYYNYRVNEPAEIELSKAHANDLDGTDMYIITANFEKILDTGLIYQVKIGNDDWIDITDKMYDLEYTDEHGYIYTYNAYWNTEFKARVLYSDGTVKDEKTISVTELGEFGILISSEYVNDETYGLLPLLTIDFKNCWNSNWTYKYSYDNENFYPFIGIGEDKKIDFKNALELDLYFRIVDNENNIIYSQDYIKYSPSNYIEIEEFAKIDENGEKYIEVKIDFSNYSKVSNLYSGILKYQINGENLVLNYSYDNYYYLQIYKENVDTNYRISVFVGNKEIAYKSYSAAGNRLLDFNEKYEEILKDNLDKEFGGIDFATVQGVNNALKKFLGAIKDIILVFISFIERFINGLNKWISTAIIAEFCLMIVCKLVKAVRK